jgi:hypothetical protein
MVDVGINEAGRRSKGKCGEDERYQNFHGTIIP